MIGLFLGDTDFSDAVLQKIKKINKKYFIIDFSKNNKFKKDNNSHRISIGKFGKIISLIKEKKSKKILFAGKIAKPKFSTLRLDLKGVFYMPGIIRAAKLGDAAIIKYFLSNLFTLLRTISEKSPSPKNKPIILFREWCADWSFFVFFQKINHFYY